MKAIVLTYDRQIGCAELLYKMYMDKWNDCPLTFRIPWNENKPSYFTGKSNVELMHCKSPIRETMASLLEDIEPDEFVFWCIDDRFPKEILDFQELNKLHHLLEASGLEYHYDAVKLCKWFGRKNVAMKNWQNSVDSELSFNLLGREYDVQVTNYAWGFYHHQFCKAKVLKALFLSDYLSDNYKLKGKGGLHTELVHGNSLQGLKMLSPRVNNVTFGEPLTNGRLTPEGLSYLAEYDCKIPEYGSTDIDKIF